MKHRVLAGPMGGRDASSQKNSGERSATGLQGKGSCNHHG